MEHESVPTSSVLFDADGTQLPDPLPVLPDALTGPEHSRWAGDIPEFTPVPLPPVPDGRAMREAIAAVLGEDSAAAAGSATGTPRADSATDAPQPHWQPYPQPQPHPQPHPQPQWQPPWQPDPAPGPQARPPAATHSPAAHFPGAHSRAALPRAVAPLGELRRRIGPESARQLQTRSSGGVRTGCVVALIIFGVVAFNIVAAIVQSVAGLFS